MKFKKSILALGSLAAIAAPVAAVVSCGVTADSKTYDITDITKGAGLAFANFNVAEQQTAINNIVKDTVLIAKADAVKSPEAGNILTTAIAEVKADTSVATSAIIRKVPGVLDNMLVVTFKVTNSGVTDKTLSKDIQIGFISTKNTLKVVLVDGKGATSKLEESVISVAAYKTLRVAEEQAFNDYTAALTTAKKVFTGMDGNTGNNTVETLAILKNALKTAQENDKAGSTDATVEAVKKAQKALDDANDALDKVKTAATAYSDARTARAKTSLSTADLTKEAATEITIKDNTKDPVVDKKVKLTTATDGGALDSFETKTNATYALYADLVELIK